MRIFPGVRTPHSHVLKAINGLNMAKNKVVEKDHPGQVAGVTQAEASGTQVRGYSGAGTKGNAILEV